MRVRPAVDTHHTLPTVTGLFGAEVRAVPEIAASSYSHNPPRNWVFRLLE